MWKAEFPTEEAHVGVAGTQQRVLFNQNGFCVWEYIPMFANSAFSVRFFPISCGDFFKTNHRSSLWLKTCLFWELYVQSAPVSGLTAFRRVLGGGINYLFAAAGCWEWDALQCWSPDEDFSSPRPHSKSHYFPHLLSMLGNGSSTCPPHLVFSFIFLW